MKLTRATVLGKEKMPVSFRQKPFHLIFSHKAHQFRSSGSSFEDRAATMAAAVSNRLFGKISPGHIEQDLELAEQIAIRALRLDSEIRYAAAVSCRARLLFETERNS